MAWRRSTDPWPLAFQHLKLRPKKVAWPGQYTRKSHVSGYLAPTAGLIKVYAGQFVTTGSIIVTQCGTKFSPGSYVRRAKNDCLFALTDGTVYFDQSGKRVNLTPTDTADTNVK